jgi:hypothetical protein
MHLQLYTQNKSKLLNILSFRENFTGSTTQDIHSEAENLTNSLNSDSSTEKLFDRARFEMLADRILEIHNNPAALKRVLDILGQHDKIEQQWSEQPTEQELRTYIDSIRIENYTNTNDISKEKGEQKLDHSQALKALGLSTNLPTVGAKEWTFSPTVAQKIRNAGYNSESRYYVKQVSGINPQDRVLEQKPDGTIVDVSNTELAESLRLYIPRVYPENQVNSMPEDPNFGTNLFWISGPNDFIQLY